MGLLDRAVRHRQQKQKPAKKKLFSSLRKFFSRSRKPSGISNEQSRKFLHDAVVNPIIRMFFCVFLAGGWYILAGLLFLDWLPANFAYYRLLISRQGTTNFDVYFFWAWVPIIFILTVGMAWSSGVLGKFWDWITS